MAVFQTGLGSFPGGVRNFNFSPGTWRVSFKFCPLLSLAVALTTDSRRSALSCVIWSIVCCSSYMHLTHEHLGCESRGIYVLRRKKEITVTSCLAYIAYFSRIILNRSEKLQRKKLCLIHTAECIFKLRHCVVCKMARLLCRSV